MMNEIIIRNLDDASVRRLQQLAWQNGRPLEDLVRVLVLEAAMARESKWPNTRFPVPTD
jgi:plasmid stability protein